MRYHASMYQTSSRRSVRHATGHCLITNVTKMWHGVKSRLNEWRSVCRNCRFVVKSDIKHECFKIFCDVRNKQQPPGHLCYVATLKPSNFSGRLRYVFFDAECTRSDKIMRLTFSLPVMAIMQPANTAFDPFSIPTCSASVCKILKGVVDLSNTYQTCAQHVFKVWIQRLEYRL
jgi:hypothetical protein